MFLGNHARAFELQVGAGDCVGIDEQSFGQDANGRDFLTGAEAAGGDEVLHLVDDLEIDRDTIRGGNMNLHRSSRSLCVLLH